jgi:hypothetical protein
MACLMTAALVGGSSAAWAQAAKSRTGGLESLAFVNQRLVTRPDIEEIGEAGTRVESKTRDGWSGFLSDAPGEWTGYIDHRTGRLESAVGAGIPWVPGRGNHLTAADVPALKGAARVDLTVLEKVARGFLPRVAPLLGVDPATLVLSKERSRELADQVWAVDFDILRGGVRIDGARVLFVVNHGNLIDFGGENLPSPGATVPKMRVGRQGALAALSEHIGGFSAADTFVDGGTYRLVPVELDNPGRTEGYEPGKGRGLMGVWEFQFRRDGSDATWRGRVDAATGKVVELLDRNDYAEVDGGIMWLGSQILRPMPSADISISPFCANSGGWYVYPGGTVTSTLTGCLVNINDNCGTISQTANLTTGEIAFGTSPGSNCSTPGFGGLGNTRSARTQFYHLNRVKEMGRGWFPSNAWLAASLTANVNINSTCNAFWSPSLGTVNFYRSGGGCGNTGEIEAVSLHEWGHGMDQNDGNGSSIDKGTGETYGDFTAALVTHRSCIGSGFRTTNCGGYGDACTSCTGVRDIDFALHTSATAHTVANFTQPLCPTSGTYQGPCGREGHCESYISSEALWDFANRDLPSPGTASAWNVAERLWYQSRPTATRGFTCVPSGTWSSHGCTTGTNWRTMRAVDDDDGNLANGTPHGGALYNAFNRHLIACTTDAGASTTFAGCTAPAAPVLQAFPANPGANLSWTNLGVGKVYDVFRNDLGCNAGFAKIKNDNATATFSDTTIGNDFVYYYQVVAHPTGNEACASVPSNCVAIRGPKTDVWSKDLPADTGLEPEPSLMSQPMWTSQDIWVRNDLTPGPHQNPEFGQVNYIHVNVRNRSSITATDTNVEFYYANASAGLAWPVDWTLIGTQNLASLSGAGPVDISQPWSPPGTGHYCLLVRLVTPQDPMTNLETTSIDYNVRYNNNIVWKNVNVVDLLPFAAQDVHFIFRNPWVGKRTIRMVFREPAGQADTFFRRGKVTVDFGDKLTEILLAQGAQPVGLKQIDNRTWEIADVTKAYVDVTLDDREEFDIGMTIEDTAPRNGQTTGTKAAVPADPVQDSNHYTFEVAEQDLSSKGEDIGGVTYEIDAPKF